jgi:hypothetical protein
MDEEEEGVAEGAEPEDEKADEPSALTAVAFSTFPPWLPTQHIHPSRFCTCVGPRYMRRPSATQRVGAEGRNAGEEEEEVGLVWWERRDVSQGG